MHTWTPCVVGCPRSDLNFASDFSDITYQHKNVLWGDLSHIQKTENLFLTKIGDASKKPI